MLPRLYCKHPCPSLHFLPSHTSFLPLCAQQPHSPQRVVHIWDELVTEVPQSGIQADLLQRLDLSVAHCGVNNTTQLWWNQELLSKRLGHRIHWSLLHHPVEHKRSETWSLADQCLNDANVHAVVLQVLKHVGMVWLPGLNDQLSQNCYAVGLQLIDVLENIRAWNTSPLRH